MFVYNIIGLTTLLGRQSNTPPVTTIRANCYSIRTTEDNQNRANTRPQHIKLSMIFFGQGQWGREAMQARRGYACHLSHNRADKYVYNHDAIMPHSWSVCKYKRALLEPVFVVSYKYIVCVVVRGMWEFYDAMFYYVLTLRVRKRSRIPHSTQKPQRQWQKRHARAAIVIRNVPVRHCKFPYSHPHPASADGTPFRSVSADFDDSNSRRSKPSLRPPTALRYYCASRIAGVCAAEHSSQHNVCCSSWTYTRGMDGTRYMYRYDDVLVSRVTWRGLGE